MRTSPYYPQSNGKLERFHGTLKQGCIRPSCPATAEEARRRVQDFVEYYNHVQLNSAIGFIAPDGMLAGRGEIKAKERDRKREKTRRRRELVRKSQQQTA